MTIHCWLQYKIDIVAIWVDMITDLWCCRLGKTIQVISFLSGLFDMEKVHAVLIVMPVSVIGNWEKEFGKWYGFFETG